MNVVSDEGGGRHCPDDGTCHHACGEGSCFRVAYCAPLSAYGDDWTAEDYKANQPGLVMPTIEALLVEDGRTVDNHWREVADCHCWPGDGTDSCPHYDRCYEVWYDFNRAPAKRP